jgi:hypothetical protein
MTTLRGEASESNDAEVWQWRSTNAQPSSAEC